MLDLQVVKLQELKSSIKYEGKFTGDDNGQIKIYSRDSYRTLANKSGQVSLSYLAPHVKAHVSRR